jgi:hypothetical protein
MRYLALVTTIILLLFRPCNSQRQLEQCVIDLGLEQQSIILGGQTVSSRDNPIVFLEQHRNGNLVVKRGRAIVWKSGITDISSTQTCFTRLQNDGHMLTFANSSASNHHAVWKTNSHGPTSSNYFLGMDCNFQQVGIYQGSSDNPGDSIWREPTSLLAEPDSNVPPPSPSNNVELAFYVMGDTPYNPKEEETLKRQLNIMTNNLHPRASFLVHVGDMQKSYRTQCSRDRFEHVREMLRKSSLPTFVLCGDNDYLDCKDSEKAWDRYLDTFQDFDKEWENKQLPSGTRKLQNVDRWDESRDVDNVGNVKRREMFAFEEDGILFISLTIMRMNKKRPPNDLFYERLAVSKAWVKRQLRRHRDKRLRGVVMFGHSMLSDSSRLKPFFKEELKEVFYDEGLQDMPVIYINGDGHQFDISGISGWRSFTRVQVDQGGKADPLLIEVAPIVDGVTKPFKVNDSDRKQFVVGEGLFRIDRQKGRYDE